MKHQITMLFLSLGMMAILWGCQKDDSNPSSEMESTAPESPFKISTIDRSKVQQNRTLNARLADLQIKQSDGKSGLQAREIYSEAYDFTIDTDNVTYIESTDGTYHSYTFEVFRSDATGSLENLLLSLQGDGSYKAILVSYDLTQQEQEDLANGLYVNFENRYSISEIDMTDFSLSTFNRMSNECVVGQNNYWMCGNKVVGHTADTSRDICHADSFDYIVEISWGLCPVDGGHQTTTHQIPGTTQVEIMVELVRGVTMATQM